MKTAKWEGVERVVLTPEFRIKSRGFSSYCPRAMLPDVPLNSFTVPMMLKHEPLTILKLPVSRMELKKIHVFMILTLDRMDQLVSRFG